MPAALHDMLVPTLPPWAVFVRASAVYLFVLIVFRLLGRQESARHRSFDIAVLFLVGAALRKTIVADDESLTSAFIGLFTLFGLDWLFATIAYRSRAFARLVEGRPLQLVRDGAIQQDALRRSRVTESELKEHLRGEGTEDVSKIRHAYIERSGRVTFILR